VGTAAGCGYLTVDSGSSDANANGEAFRVFVFAGVRFTVRGVKEETSPPQPRLVIIHLHSPQSRRFCAAQKKSNSLMQTRQRNTNRSRVNFSRGCQRCRAPNAKK
jgi:hypothetical protein